MMKGVLTTITTRADAVIQRVVPHSDTPASPASPVHQIISTKAYQVGNEIKVKAQLLGEEVNDARERALSPESTAALKKEVMGNENVKVVLAAASYSKGVVDTKMEVASEAIRSKAIELIDDKLDIALLEVWRRAKDTAVDPDMPDMIKIALRGIIDEMMPEVKQVIMEKVCERLRPNVVSDTDDEVFLTEDTVNIFQRIRGMILHSLFPYDRSLWSKLKDVRFYLFLAVTMTPWMGLAQICWTLLFFLRDLRDEYQLVNFIISFKVSLCISLGVVSMYSALPSLLLCQGDVTSNCPEPPQIKDYIIEVYFFLAQIVITWFAAFLIQFSKRKGGPLYKPAQSSSAAASVNDVAMVSKKGGRIIYFLLFDLIGFCLVFGYGLYSVYVTTDGFRLDWSAAMMASNSSTSTLIYWLKVIYGIFCIPWLICSLPGMYVLILHLKPTGYDRYGNTRRRHIRRVTSLESPSSKSKVIPSPQ